MSVQTFQTDMKGEMFVVCIQCIAVVWEEAGKDGSAVKRSRGAECVGPGSGARELDGKTVERSESECGGVLRVHWREQMGKGADWKSIA